MVEIRSKMTKEQRYRISPSGSKRNSMGKSKDNEVGMKQMNNKKTRHIVVVTHAKENISTTREHEEEDVRRKEENCNIGKKSMKFQV